MRAFFILGMTGKSASVFAGNEQEADGGEYADDSSASPATMAINEFKFSTEKPQKKEPGEIPPAILVMLLIH
ncbi:hypothetical protein EIL18_10350 [Salmonella enterica subsp. enterica]|nr:hypothetical protein [Salmonella enterica subsp. enterica]